MRGKVVGNAKTDYEEILKYGRREILFYRWRQLGGEVVEMQEVGKGTNPPGSQAGWCTFGRPLIIRIVRANRMITG